MYSNPIKHGQMPYKIAVIHGGPGAPGTVTDMAGQLSDKHSALEPLQTAMSVDGQINELRAMLKKHAKLPVTLIGHSWGAWLAFMFTARYPSYVKKLILVSSGPFEEHYARSIMSTRLERLGESGRQEYLHLSTNMNDPAVRNKNSFFARFGKLMSDADSFDLESMLKINPEHCHDCYDLNKRVWEEADYLRRSKKLLKMGKDIHCPVVAIHGDYDPHPYEGVKKPLSQTLENFRFILLENCGHYPWLERYAAKEFYQALEKELENRK
jgi:pimeloyl-ACP methyl ester carboxylesterase